LAKRLAGDKISDNLMGHLGNRYALVSFVVFLVFALARRYMSAAPMKSPTDQVSLDDLDARFRSTKWIVGLSLVVIGILFFVSVHAAFVWLNRVIAAADGPAEFRLWPQNAIWWFFPGFGALALSWEITLQLWSQLGNRDDANLYAYWSNQRTGFDATRLLRWMAVLIALPIGVLTVLALPMHTVFRQNDIRNCGYAFAPCKVYRYADARRLTVIEGFRDRDGKLVERAGVVIDFADGRRWSSADVGDFNKTVDPAFADLLARKTKLTFNYAQTEADIPQFISFRRQAAATMIRHG
jgi:hypothetical protein